MYTSHPYLRGADNNDSEGMKLTLQVMSQVIHISDPCCISDPDQITYVTNMESLEDLEVTEMVLLNPDVCRSSVRRFCQLELSYSRIVVFLLIISCSEMV